MRRVLGLLAAALVLAACGVPQDDAPRALTPADVPFRLPGSSPVPDPEGARRVALHFVRDGRVVQTTRPVQRSPSTTELLRMLLEGPAAEEREAGTLSVIPTALTVEDVQLQGDTAVVTLGGPEEEVRRTQPLAYAQIVATLTPGRAAGVRFRVNGADLPVPRGDGSLTDQPLRRADYVDLLAAPRGPAPTPSA